MVGDGLTVSWGPFDLFRFHCQIDSMISMKNVLLLHPYDDSRHRCEMDTVSGRENAHEQEFQRFDDEIVSGYACQASSVASPTFQNKKQMQRLEKVDPTLQELPEGIPDSKAQTIRDYCAELNRIENIQWKIHPL